MFAEHLESLEGWLSWCGRVCVTSGAATALDESCVLWFHLRDGEGRRACPWGTQVVTSGTIRAARRTASQASCACESQTFGGGVFARRKKFLKMKKVVDRK